MHLELDELEEFFKLFDGKEIETPVFIGQMNYATKETMSVDVVLSTRFVDEAEVVVTYKENVGLAELPNNIYNREETKSIFESQQKELRNLDVLAESKKKELIKLLKEKGFDTYKGIWTDES